MQEDLEAVAFDRDQQPLSYMTCRQREFFEVLSQGTVIPATARNLDAFRRVRLPFKSLAILDFGGAVLLPSGEIDSTWDATVRPQALAMEDKLNSALRAIEAFNRDLSLGARVRLIADFGMPLYVIVKHPQADTSVLRRIRESAIWPKGDEWFTHMNDNNLSLVPSFLGKEGAVAHVIERHLDRRKTLILGCADSDSDAPFLKLCDFAIVPPRSQIGQRIGIGTGE